jgi:hypothetical protein
MSISLAEVIKQTRLEHPAFTRENVPGVVLGQGLSEYQRDLIKQSADRLQSLVVDRFNLVFAFGDTDPAALLMTATDFGVVTGVPAFLGANGNGITIVDEVPVADSSNPKETSFEDGLLLPPNHKLLGGTARYSNGNSGVVSDPSSSPIFLNPGYGQEFKIVDYTQRFSPPHFPSGYILDEKLYLTGNSSDWAEYTGIEVHYVPLPIDLALPSQSFRLPDMCRGALAAKANMIAAKWAASRGRQDVDVKYFKSELIEAEQKLLDAVSDRQSKVTRTLKRNR